MEGQWGDGRLRKQKGHQAPEIKKFFIQLELSVKPDLILLENLQQTGFLGEVWQGAVLLFYGTQQMFVFYLEHYFFILNLPLSFP